MAKSKITTVEQALAEVREYGLALENVPEKFKTAEVCLEAVKQNGNALEYVPEKLKTAEICLEAVKDYGMALEFVPESLKTEELCLEAMNGNSDAFKFVPENLKTAELCLKAVRQNGDAIRYVPEKLRTAELCLEAVKQDGRALEYVPEKLKTEEVCLEAVKSSGYALQYVPEKLKTAEVCHEAVRKDGSNFQYVPEKLKTEEFYLEALKNNSINFVFLPEEMRRRLEESGEYQPPKKFNMVEISIRAQTGEEIRFEFDNLNERELNPSPPKEHEHYRPFSKDSVFYTDKLEVFVTIPDHREVPKSITLKLTNIGKTAEHDETVINCRRRVAKADIKVISVLFASMGRPRNGYKYRQKAEITLNFENRTETLVCPISGTTTFNMCFYDAYEARRGRHGSVVSINEFPDKGE